MRAVLIVSLSLAVASSAQAAGPYAFYPVEPCRIPVAAYAIDAHYTAADAKLDAGFIRLITISGNCAVPADAKVAVFNITAVNAAGPGHIILWASGASAPSTSNLNYNAAGDTVANSATVQLGVDGKINAVAGVSSVAALLLDVQGYFK